MHSHDFAGAVWVMVLLAGILMGLINLGSLL
jgi:hypothetical protein